MFRKLALFSLLLAFSVTLLGTYARLSEAGLGCPDWPGCFGQMMLDEIEPQAPSEAAEAQITLVKTAHHYLAGGLGVVALALFVMSFWVRERKLSTVLLSLLTLGLIGGEAALGFRGREWVHLPLVTSAHVLTALLTMALLYWLSLTQSPIASDRPLVSGGTRWLARFSLLIVLLQIGLGVWTSANQAGLACQEFPICLGSYDPPVDYLSAFNLPQLVGAEATLPFAAKAAIHWAHRIGAAVVFVLLTLLALGLTSNPRAPRLSKAALLLNFLLLAQIALGIATVLLRLPVFVVVAHSAIAALVFLNVLHFVFFLRAPLRVPEARKEPTLRRELPEIPGETIEPPSLVITPEEVLVEVVAKPKPRREVVPPPPSENLFSRLKAGLGKTRGGLTGFLGNLALGKKTIDGDLLEDIEAQLLMADIGVTATSEIIRDLTDSVERSQLADVDALTARLREQLYDMIEPVSQPLVIPDDKRPFVILVVGVNGVGKTTTIGKLANRLRMQGHSVMLAAGDTFRAAAVEQLQTWGERNDIQVISQGSGADSASVIFDGLKAAQARGVDILIADTAGRLHTKSNLMGELSKIKRIMAKLDPEAPHEILLVLDGGTGQNALSQAKQFNEAVGLTGLAVTKLDGTAKGGVVFALAKQFGIPIRFIGVGESIEDLQDFDARKFIEALFAD
jgi:fused signal recognition particle receptor